LIEIVVLNINFGGGNLNKQITIDEIYEIILMLGEDAKKIPENVVRFFEENSTKPFKKRLDFSKGLEGQNFSLETNCFIKYIAQYLK